MMRLILLTALTMMAFAANSVLNRLAVGSGRIGVAEFALVRLGAGAVTLLVFLALRRVRSGRAVWPGWRGRILGAVALLTYLFGFSVAYAALPAGAGALILFGTVQITMFAGAIAAGEGVPLRRWAGAGVAFCGLVLLLGPGREAISLPHAAAMVVAGLGWGVYSLAGRAQADALAATAWNFVLALPLGLCLAAVLPWRVAVPATGAGLALAVLSGAVTSGLGYALWYRVLPDLGAARAAVAQLTVPVIAAAGGFALLGEGLSLRFVVCAVLVLGGVGIAMLPRGS